MNRRSGPRSPEAMGRSSRDEGDDLPFAPAAERNKGPIAAVLASWVQPGDRVLEIGAGTGQHAVAFSEALECLDWLPTERAEALPGLLARVTRARQHNPDAGPEPACRLRLPQCLDVETGPWPEGPFDLVFTANTCHIMSWAAVEAMLRGAAAALRDGGLAILYGPFIQQGRYRSEGDRRFDQALRAGNAGSGLREVEAIETAFHRHHLSLEAAIDMPANNLTLVFRKGPPNMQDDARG